MTHVISFDPLVDFDMPSLVAAHRGIVVSMVAGVMVGFPSADDARAFVRAAGPRIRVF